MVSFNLISSISLPSHSTELDDPLKLFAALEVPTPPCLRLADAIWLLIRVCVMLISPTDFIALSFEPLLQQETRIPENRELGYR